MLKVPTNKIKIILHLSKWFTFNVARLYVNGLEKNSIKTLAMGIFVIVGQHITAYAQSLCF